MFKTLKYDFTKKKFEFFNEERINY